MDRRLFHVLVDPGSIPGWFSVAQGVSRLWESFPRTCAESTMSAIERREASPSIDFNTSLSFETLASLRNCGFCFLCADSAKTSLVEVAAPSSFRCCQSTPLADDLALLDRSDLRGRVLTFVFCVGTVFSKVAADLN